jgi:hypothetical protein
MAVFDGTDAVMVAMGFEQISRSYHFAWPSRRREAAIVV